MTQVPVLCYVLREDECLERYDCAFCPDSGKCGYFDPCTNETTLHHGEKCEPFATGEDAWTCDDKANYNRDIAIFFISVAVLVAIGVAILLTWSAIQWWRKRKAERARGERLKLIGRAEI